MSDLHDSTPATARTDEERHRARLAVAVLVRDVDEARQLLDMLGLL